MQIITDGAPVDIPTPHRYATIMGNAGATYHLFGYHAWNTTARFTLLHEHPETGVLQVVLKGADWPTMWKWMGERGWRHIETKLRASLPPRQVPGDDAEAI